MKLSTRFFAASFIGILTYGAGVQPTLGAEQKSAEAAAVSVAELLSPTAAETEQHHALRGMLLSIAQGGDINAKDADGWTALMHAAAQNERLTVCWLVAKGADVTLKNKDGKTAQQLAHTIAQRELLDLCTKENASRAAKISLKNATSLERLALVIRRSGSVNMKGMYAYALEQTDATYAQLLFALGMKENGASIMLYSAIMRDDVQAAVQLAKKNPKLLITALSYAQSGEMVKALVASGAKPKSSDLHAALSKDASVARELIAAGAPITTPPVITGGIINPFCILDFVTNGDVVDVLVQAGEDPNKKRPLDRALHARNLSVVQAFLRNGVKADDEAIKTLLSTGTSEDMNAPEGMDTTDRFRDVPKILAELIKAGAKMTSSCWWHLGLRLSTPHFHPRYSPSEEREADVEIIRTLLNCGITPPKDALLYFNGSNLEFKDRLTRIARLLLAAGADPKAVGNGINCSKGATTLMRVGNADAELAQQLIDAGADPLAHTGYGSALTEATTPEVVDLLLSKGANKGDLVKTMRKAVNSNNTVLIEYLKNSLK